METTLSHRYKVGDRVRFKLGARDVVATVVEDRGLIGHRGEQLVRVAATEEAPDDGAFEVSSSLVRPAR